MFKKTILSMLFCFSAHSIYAADPVLKPGDITDAGEGVRTSLLPINGVMAAEKNHSIRFISTNGRYHFKGEVYDNWEGKVLHSIEDVQKSSNTLDLSNIEFQTDELAPFVIGNGFEDVIIFTDPLCKNCESIIKEAVNLDKNKYKVKILPIPALSAESADAVRLLGCAVNKKHAVSALVTQKGYSSLKQVGLCDSGGMQRRIISAQLLGVTGVPFLIREDGKISRGKPSVSLVDWLK